MNDRDIPGGAGDGPAGRSSDLEQIEPRRDSFLAGALILTGATLLVRVIGIAQKIPLWHLLGPVGVGIYNFPYPFYAILLAISSTGINIAISKIVAERMASGDQAGALNVFRISRVVMSTLGIFTAVTLAVLGKFLAVHVNHDPRAALSYWVLAPAVFADTLQAAYRGFFQGLQNMRPNALSQVAEQLIRVVVMLSVSWVLLRQTGDLGIAAAGATFGSTAGAIGSFLLLTWIYRAAGPRIFSRRMLAAPPRREPVWPLVRRIFNYAIPISLAGMGLPLLMLADSGLVSPRLQAAGFTLEYATGQYGILANNATPLINLPTILTGALFVSLVPAITESLQLGRKDQVLHRSRSALRVTMLFSFPAAVGLYTLAGGILHLLTFGPETTPVAQALTFALIFITLQQTTSGILQGLGRSREPVINMFLGALLKAVLTYFLVYRIGVEGAAYGTAAGFLLTVILNFWWVYREVGPVVEFGDMVVKPGVAAAAMGLVLVPTYPFLLRHLHSMNLSTLVAIAVGAAVYGLVLALLGGVREADLALIPKVGRPLARILSRLHLLRA
ncbi:MAG: putative polysaccharide biosynthesis protein [Symbiobacteriia bacterium]